MEEQSSLVDAVGHAHLPPSLKTTLTNYAAGALAGSACIATGFAFDTVKVRQQNPHNPYNNAWHCATSIVRQEGVRSLYRGMSPQLLGGMMETSVNFGVYHAAKDFAQGPRLGLSEVAAVPLAAAVSGFAMSIVLTPAELLKCRMQVSGVGSGRPAMTSPMDCLRHIVRTEGVRGLARGMTGTMARDVPGNAVYFCTYRLLRHWLPGKAEAGEGAAHRGLLQHLIDASSAVACGGLAGMVLWSVVLPMDVAKTRMQTANPGSKYDVDILRQLRLLHKERGVRGLYAGLSPALMRAFPANAAQWLAWETCMTLLDR